MLAGRREFIAEAWQWKQRLGGAMRQAGIIAAGGVFALRHHIERLPEDHANARVLAEGLAQLRGLAVRPQEVETNIVIVDVSRTGLSAQQFSDRLLSKGLRMSLVGPYRLRAVTHLDVSRKDVEQALAIIKDVLKPLNLPE